MGRIIIMLALIVAGAYVAHGYVTTHFGSATPSRCITVKDDATGKSFDTCHLPGVTPTK